MLTACQIARYARSYSAQTVKYRPRSRNNLQLNVSIHARNLDAPRSIKFELQTSGVTCIQTIIFNSLQPPKWG